MNYSDLLMHRIVYKVPQHTLLTGPQDGFVEVGKMPLSTAVFQKTELKLEAVCQKAAEWGSPPGLKSKPTAYLTTPHHALVAKLIRF